MLLADDLNGLGADAIARDERVRAFDRLQVPPQATLTRGTVIRIGQLVGATTVVTGRIELLDRNLALHVQSVRIDTGRISLEFDERGTLDDLLAIVERAARRLVPAERDGHSPGRGAAARCRPSSSTSRACWPRRRPRKSAFSKRRSRWNPAFDRARLALGRAHAVTGEWLKAREAALAVPAGSPYAARAQLEGAVAEIGLTRFDEAFARLKALGDQTGAPEVFNNLGVHSAAARRDRAKRAAHVFLQPGRRSRSRPSRLRLQPGLRLLAGAGLPGGGVLAARGRATRARRQRRALRAGRRAAGHRRGHRGGAGARARAAPVGGVRGTGTYGAARHGAARSRTAAARISIRPALDARTRR